MEVIKFILEGNTAFFKVPEVNTYYSFTYGNIHKVALMGIFGAMLGYGGYHQMKALDQYPELYQEHQRKTDEYPEFYSRLKDLELAIVPKDGSKGYIARKVQSFNNSVGYASQEQGGNLIVKQQWLEAPWWEIYLKVQDEESERIKKALLEKNCVYVPYLGSNDHPANIHSAEMAEGIPVAEEELERIDSFFTEGSVEVDYDDDEVVPFQYTEFLPVGLAPHTHMYQQRKFIFTNLPVVAHKSEVICVNKKNLIFF